MQLRLDLSEPQAVAERLAEVLARIPAGRFATASLINNASVISQPRPLPLSDLAEVARVVRVGLEAPLLLTAAFLHETCGWAAERRVLHVSSGASEFAMPSQAAYCAVKAAIDHLARCQQAEEQLSPRPARVCAVAPGVIDTDMQAQLRLSDPAYFPHHDMYVRMKDEHRLVRPEKAAAKLVALLRSSAFATARS